MTYIGIDPGLTGAVAAIDVHGNARVVDLPTKAMEYKGIGNRRIDLRALVLLLRDLVPASVTPVVAVERVGIMGPKGNALASVGSLCGTAQLILGALDVFRVAPVIADPVVWKRELGLKRERNGDKPEATAAWKARSRELAKALYPKCADAWTLAKHADRAEALLIAHWAKERHA
jgi:hypothetical protein